MGYRDVVDTVAQRLQDASWPNGVRACAYRAFADPSLGEVIDVVLILESDEWTDDTYDLCERGSQIAESALADIAEYDDVMTSCRTREEHAQFAPQEEGLWTEIDAGACSTLPG